MNASSKEGHAMLDPRMRDVGPVETTPLFDMVVDLDPKLDFGRRASGQRILFGSAGGRFEGPRLRGKVLPGGGDWTLFRPDGVMTLDVRLTLRTDEGSLIYMTYGGRWVTPPELRTEMSDPAKRHAVDPARYYFRSNPLFETGSEVHGWLNEVVCVGKGYLVQGGIGYSVFEVR